MYTSTKNCFKFSRLKLSLQDRLREHWRRAELCTSENCEGIRLMCGLRSGPLAHLTQRTRCGVSVLLLLICSTLLKTACPRKNIQTRKQANDRAVSSTSPHLPELCLFLFPIFSANALILLLLVDPWVLFDWYLRKSMRILELTVDWKPLCEE